MKTAILIMLLLIGFASCNPVKQVLKNKDYYEQVKKKVIANGDCVTDTVKVEVIKEVEVVGEADTVKVPCDDFKIDTGGVKIEVKKGKIKVVKEIVKVTETVRDRGYETALKDSLTYKDQVIRARDTTIKTQQAEIRELRASNRKKMLQIIGLTAVFVGFTFRKQIFRLFV